MYCSWSFITTIIFFINVTFSCLLIMTTVASNVVVMMTHNEDASSNSSSINHEDFTSTTNYESYDAQYTRIVKSPSSLRKRNNASHSLLMKNTNLTSTTRIIKSQSEPQKQQRNRIEQTLVCNGLENLCDKRVNEIMFAAPHNANAALMNGYKILPNHIRILEQAIQSGYRSINIDMAKCYEKKNSLQLIHGLCILDKRNPYHVFNHINNFLINNPNEVIMIVIEIDFQRNIRFPLSDIYTMLQTIPGFIERMYSHPDRLNPFTSNRTSWPTLRELIQLDQRIILFTYYGESCFLNPTVCPGGFHDWFAYAGETEFELPKIDSIRNVSYSCRITRGNNGRVDFVAMNHFLQIPRIGITSHQLNQYSFLKQRIKDCTAFNNRTISTAIVDFWDTGNVLQVVNDLNSQL